MDTKFSEAWRGFILAKRSENVVPKVLVLYEWSRSQWEKRMGDMQLDSITPDHIRRFILWLRGEDKSDNGDAAIPASPSGKSGKPLSSYTVDIHFRNLKCFFIWCEDEEILPRSPMRKVKRPKVEKGMVDILTESEVNTLLEKVRTGSDRHSFRDYVIHLFFIYTGVRLNELASINVADIDLDLGYAKILQGKGRKPRLVPLEINLRRELSRYLLRYRKAVKGEIALFVNSDGYRFEARGVQSMIIASLKLNVETEERKIHRCGPHTLRHTFGTFNWRATKDIESTSKILGHTTTRTTEAHYLHLVGTDVLSNIEESSIGNYLKRFNGHGRDSLHANDA